MTKKALSLAGLIFILANAFGQVEIGDKAPAISVSQWVDNPQFDFKEMNGKAVVLDFWFTQCAPCVYTIPHLNDLSEKFKGDSIVFVSITFEQEDVVRKFLEKKKILANIGIDTLKTSIHTYDVKAYPITFLIDKNGMLRWKGYPSHLNSDLIELALDKKFYPDLNGISNIKPKVKNDIPADYIYPISVSKNDYMDEASGMQITEDEISMVNQSIRSVMASLLRKSVKEIQSLDTNRYDIRFKISDELPHNQVVDEFIKSLLNELDLAIENTIIKLNGFELQVVYDSLFVQNALNQGKVYYSMSTSTNQEFWIGNGVQMQQLKHALESRFNENIIDKTNFYGFFEFQFPIASFNIAREYLLQRYGIALIPNLIEVEITEVK